MVNIQLCLIIHELLFNCVLEEKGEYSIVFSNSWVIIYYPL